MKLLQNFINSQRAERARHVLHVDACIENVFHIAKQLTTPAMWLLAFYIESKLNYSKSHCAIESSVNSGSDLSAELTPCQHKKRFTRVQTAEADVASSVSMRHSQPASYRSRV
jgi:hypothetical protein